MFKLSNWTKVREPTRYPLRPQSGQYIMGHVPIPRYELAMAWIARVLVCALLLVAPWPYGMADWASQMWLVPVVGAILLLSSLVALARRISVGNPLVWSLAAILVVGFVQVIPLPTTLWELLSPAAGFEQRVDELASEFSQSTSEPAATEGTQPESSAATDIPAIAHTISIDPLRTRATICVFAMGLAMLISVGILFRDRVSVAVLLATISLSGLAIALLGIYQGVVAGDWTLLEVPKTTSFGTFFSRNSAPQFLACAFGATAGFLALYHAYQTKQQEKSVDKRYRIVYPSVNLVARLRRRAEQFVTEADLLTAICLLVMALLFISVLAANSRGGTLAFMASGMLLVAVYALGRQAGWSAAVVILILVVSSGLFLSLFGIDEIIGARMDTISEEAYKLDNVRLKIWQLAFSQPSCWALGSGLGTFHFALLPDYPTPSDVQYAHAENIYVELASNAGVVTLVIALGGLLWLVWQLLTKYSNSNAARASRFACLFAVLAVGLQNMVDFSLMLPAVFLPLAALVGSYVGTRHQVRHKVRLKSTQRSSQSHSHTNRLPSAERDRPGALTHSPTASRQRASAPTQSNSVSAADDPPWAPAALIVCLLIISCAVAVGYRPLAALAYAEQLKVSSESQELLTSIEVANDSQWGEYPESLFKIGRMRQALAEQQLFESDNWPAYMSQTDRASLAQPQFFSTVFHGTTDPGLIELREFLESEPAALENLADSQFDMRAALAACPLDWRASWGLMRADMGEMSELQRHRNYARILLTARANVRVLQAAGTHALMIGETSAGLRIWREILPVYYSARYQVLELLDRFLTIEQLISVLPPSPLQRIEMAKAIVDKFPDASQAIVAVVDLKEAFTRSKFAADWVLVAWCAQQQRNLPQEIDAWEQAVLADPMNHALSYSLALAFQRGNHRADALKSINEALELSPDNAIYETLKEQLDASSDE